MSERYQQKHGVSRWLPSFWRRGTSESQQPLLYSPHESDEYRVAKDNINTIICRAYINVYGHKFVQEKRLPADEESRRCREELEKAWSKIMTIYDSKPRYFWLVGWVEILDHATMGILDVIAATCVKYNEEIRSFNDIAAAYVIKELVYHLKSDRMYMDGESLIHRTVREFEYTFGPIILDAIASRKDQHFRSYELRDKEIIGKFKARYGGAKLKAFISR
jgi:hypothetical protein